MSKKKLIPLSRLHDYVRVTQGRSVRSGESLLSLVAKTIQERLHVSRSGSVRAFIELHRDEVMTVAGRPVAKVKKARPAAKSASPYVARPSVPVESDAFLLSYEWRRLRMEALKLHGARCQCCGATPATGAVMNVDHIKPRRVFPRLALEMGNLQVLCHECNHGKGNWDMTDWRPAFDPDAVSWDPDSMEIQHLRSI